MNYLLENTFFQDCYNSLADCSIDDSDKNNIVKMINESFEYAGDQVINFDSVKTKLCGQFNKSNEVFKSADCLIYNHNNGKYIIVEFKNGKVTHVKEKLKDSLHIFNEILGKNLDFCRSECEYIVVYNYEKNRCYVNQEIKKEYKDGAIEEGYKEFFDTSFKLAEKEIYLFGVNLMKGICVSDVHTYDIEQFKNYYNKNCCLK